MQLRKRFAVYGVSHITSTSADEGEPQPGTWAVSLSCELQLTSLSICTLMVVEATSKGNIAKSQETLPSLRGVQPGASTRVLCEGRLSMSVTMPAWSPFCTVIVKATTPPATVSGVSAITVTVPLVPPGSAEAGDDEPAAAKTASSTGMTNNDTRERAA